MLILEVFDGESPDQDEVIVIASIVKTPPNADAGNDQTVNVGDLIALDGSGSNDPDNCPDPLTFSWTFVSIPVDSVLVDADITDANTDTPSFIPDVEGSYLLRLDISDGVHDDFDQVMVEAIKVPDELDPPQNLLARAKGSHINVLWDETSGATSYRVFRRLDTELEFIDAGQTTYSVFVDDLPQQANSAEYFVVAENNFGISDDSAVVLVTKTTRRRR